MKKKVLNYDTWYLSSTGYATENLAKTKIPREAKGLYVTGNTASNQKIDGLINLLQQSELNALVIDVKEDAGYVTYKSKVPQVMEITSDRKNFISDIDVLLQRLKENNNF